MKKTDDKNKLRVFLCHASDDKPKVRELYKRLTSDGIDVWLDEEKLLPGQEWAKEIPEAVRKSDIIIVCLSEKSISKDGYVQKEITHALDIADEKPEGTIYIIPLRLEECNVPGRLRRWQWADMFIDGTYERLLRSINKRVDEIGEKIQENKNQNTESVQSILFRVMPQNNHWILVSQLKQQILRVDPYFNEKNYGFHSFKDFLISQVEIIETRGKGGNFEARLKTKKEEKPHQTTKQIYSVELDFLPPKEIVEVYLEILKKQKIRMTPNEHRPRIIIKYYEIAQKSKTTVNQLRDDVVFYYKNNFPSIEEVYVEEASYQLFHTFCFDFEDPNPNETIIPRIWDRPLSISPEIQSSTDFLNKCDVGVLWRIGKGLGEADKINLEAAALLLYGRITGKPMLDHINELISNVYTQSII